MGNSSERITMKPLERFIRSERFVSLNVSERELAFLRQMDLKDFAPTEEDFEKIILHLRNITS